jgi:GNAT superfamily N-acetyltransferase
VADPHDTRHAIGSPKEEAHVPVANRGAVRISVRRAEPGDVESIARIHVAAWHHAYRGLVPDEAIALRTVQRRLEQWGRILQDESELVLVGCDDAALARAFASATLRLEDRFQSHLETLYVEPELWRHGIGRALLSSVIAMLQARGANNMSLRTLRLGQAKAFYERLGARQVPEGVADDDDPLLDTVALAFDDLSAPLGRIPETKSPAREGHLPED